MLAIKSMQVLGSGILPVSGISPLIPTLFLSLIFLYSSVAPLTPVGLLLGWSQQVQTGGPGCGLMANCGLPGSGAGHSVLAQFPWDTDAVTEVCVLLLIGKVMITLTKEGRKWSWEEDCYPAVC